MVRRKRSWGLTIACLGFPHLQDVGAKAPVAKVTRLELNQELYDLLLQAGQPASTQPRKSSTGLGPSHGIDPSESFARILSGVGTHVVVVREIERH